MGCRTIRTQKNRDAILRLLRDANTREVACTVAGIGRTSFYAWLKDDPDFAAACEMAEAECHAELVALVFAEARKGTPQWAAYFLERKYRETWGRVERTEISGPNGNPIATTAEAKLDKAAVAALYQAFCAGDDKRGADGDAP